MVINDLKGDGKMDFSLGNKQVILQEPCVTGTSEGWNIVNDKMNRKLSKNVWQSTQHNCENGRTMTQKKMLKLNIILESIKKKNVTGTLCKQLHEKSGTVP